MIQIVQEGDPVLRQKAKEVPIESIDKPKIKKIISDMKEALHSQNDGVAIAAPQIGIPLRIFVVSGIVFDEDFLSGKIDSSPDYFKKNKHSDLVFINPIIKKISKDKKLMQEGCLSVRPIYGKVRRATRATVEAYDQKGNKFVKNGSGLLAHIFQHETDHLNGILFTDKAKDLFKLTADDKIK